MKAIEAFLVSSFTKDGTGGNPAGVVLHAEALSNEEKLKIAQAVGYSETAFVSRDDEVDFEVSFFTVTDEVDFCGHATLAVFSVLYQENIVNAGRYVQRTKAGLLGVTIETNGQITMEQALPEYRGELSYEAISTLIGIAPEVIRSTQLPVEVVSTGLPDIIVPLPNGYLDSIEINEELTRHFCKEHEVVGIHAFELYEQNADMTASCRNFAPLFGIAEESATGSASGALACYLTKHLRSADTHHFVFEQGRAMHCISRIIASTESDKQGITKVRVGGFARTIGRQSIDI
ncbi:PhzF family phenazine biosynthesis protein [Vibrio vulnificus]|nr:PhzF family phenazine biosynthesis protein [Vibrio vulnificus]EHI9275990.1 PhzF family phenazine biosynthesis protein [Vibrio vulnificus]EHU4866532.1 PhzF family phenazine biosynthesis protein [Vibrio vulnificus]EIA1320799.1 PhzF family phenazine biosynthesis protein [Vibrio vulnificus]EIT7118154.1 PhzF family phenazine biosynthesis protein [Vibrio vulnificus]